MKSMTGFGFGEGQAGNFHYSIDLKSYNNRYLDLILQLPPALSAREPEIRDWLAGLALRGRVELTIRVRENAENVKIKVNEAAASAWMTALDGLKRRHKLPGKVALEHLLGLEGVFETERGRAPDDLWQQMKPVVDQVGRDFTASRQREGAKTLADLTAQLGVVQDGWQVIKGRAGEMEGLFRDNLKKRLSELQAEVDENRLLAETALLLMRYGINEELVRLESHLAAFRELAASGQPVGKKLDFLCQEIGREINTIGSKTTLAEVQMLVVGMKDALENIREQLRNVE